MHTTSNPFEINYQAALVRNFASNCLGHLYNLTVQISETSNTQLEQDRKAFLTHWCQELLHQFLKIKNHPPVADLQNCDSVLWVAPEEDKKNYQVEDFNNFFRFINLSLGTLKHRFVVIESAHLLMQRELYQKLLKTLEEPPPKTTLILLNWENALLSETLESRAITLTIRHQGLDLSLDQFANLRNQNFLQALTQLTEGQSLSPLLVAYLSGEKSLSLILSEIGEASIEATQQLQSTILTLCQLFPIPYSTLEEIQQTMRQINQWQTFNNPRSTALVLLLRILKLMDHMLQSASASPVDR